MLAACFPFKWKAQESAAKETAWLTASSSAVPKTDHEQLPLSAPSSKHDSAETPQLRASIDCNRPAPLTRGTTSAKPQQEHVDRRAQLVLEENICAVTLLSMDVGGLLSQSAASRAYYNSLQLEGVLLPREEEGCSAWNKALMQGSTLASLFSCQPETLEDCMQCVQSGYTWEGVIPVPLGRMQATQTHRVASYDKRSTGASHPQPVPKLSRVEEDTSSSGSDFQELLLVGDRAKSDVSTCSSASSITHMTSTNQGTFSSDDAVSGIQGALSHNPNSLRIASITNHNSHLLHKSGDVSHWSPMSGKLTSTYAHPAGMAAAPHSTLLSHKRLLSMLNFTNTQLRMDSQHRMEREFHLDYHLDGQLRIDSQLHLESQPFMDRIKGSRSFDILATAPMGLQAARESEPTPSRQRELTYTKSYNGRTPDAVQATREPAASHRSFVKPGGSCDVVPEGAEGTDTWPLSASRPMASPFATVQSMAELELQAQEITSEAGGEQRLGVQADAGVPDQAKVGVHEDQHPAESSGGTAPQQLESKHTSLLESVSEDRPSTAYPDRHTPGTAATVRERRNRPEHLRVSFRNSERESPPEPGSSGTELQAQQDHPGYSLCNAPEQPQDRQGKPSPSSGDRRSSMQDEQGNEAGHMAGRHQHDVTDSEQPHWPVSLDCPPHDFLDRPSQSPQAFRRASANNVDVRPRTSSNKSAHILSSHSSKLVHIFDAVSQHQPRHSGVSGVMPNRGSFYGAENNAQQSMKVIASAALSSYCNVRAPRCSNTGSEGSSLSLVSGEGQPEHGQADESDRRSPSQPSCYHKVTARPTVDPDTGRMAIVLTQIDVTAQVEMEEMLQGLARAQLTVLSQGFPRHIVEFFSHTGTEDVPAHMGSLARSHQDVTILFMDIAGFTSMSKDVAPHTVLTLLNSLFTRFDALCDVHGVQKVDTAGDSYIVACGVLAVDGEGFYTAGEQGFQDPVECAHRVMAFATDMLLCAKEVIMPHNQQQCEIRIGIHTGECVSGLVGTRLPKFTLFGDSMNTASRMESTSRLGRIQVSKVTRELLATPPSMVQLPFTFRTYEWEVTGGVQIKGKGMMETFLWVPHQGWGTDLEQPPALSAAPQQKQRPLSDASHQTSHPSSMVLGHSGVVCADGEQEEEGLLGSVDLALAEQDGFAMDGLQLSNKPTSRWDWNARRAAIIRAKTGLGGLAEPQGPQKPAPSANRSSRTFRQRFHSLELGMRPESMSRHSRFDRSSNGSDSTQRGSQYLHRSCTDLLGAEATTSEEHTLPPPGAPPAGLGRAQALKAAMAVIARASIARASGANVPGHESGGNLSSRVLPRPPAVLPTPEFRHKDVRFQDWG